MLGCLLFKQDPTFQPAEVDQIRVSLKWGLPAAKGGGGLRALGRRPYILEGCKYNGVLFRRTITTPDGGASFGTSVPRQINK